MAGRHQGTAALPDAQYRRPASLDSTGLVATLWSEDGTNAGVFDFTPLPGSLQLRQQFAAAFVRKIGPAGQWRSWDTCYTGYQSVRLLLRGLAASEQPPETIEQITPAMWVSWRMSLPPSAGTRHHLISLRSLLLPAPELSPETREVVDRRVEPAPAPTEVAYTYQEYLRIRSAAATVFNSAAIRIRDNREHLRRWRAGEFTAASNDWLIGEALDCVARTGEVPLLEHVSGWRRPSRRHTFEAQIRGHTCPRHQMIGLNSSRSAATPTSAILICGSARMATRAALLCASSTRSRPPAHTTTPSKTS
ncbi:MULTISPECIES: hypothetical protein [Rhodococcus erythropolis group]|uniref:hypothetical protein n=1 Tax=Rhodococcus erythropolis group TaxID=2840174 RepID=UPI001F336E68|nr:MULTISPECIES: hypothetical protein [Rhodococcus erythropolis group]